jgi:hypothetical protein
MNSIICNELARREAPQVEIARDEGFRSFHSQEKGGFSRDSGFICLICHSVYTFQKFFEGKVSFCPLCGSKFSEDSNVSYSAVADLSHDKAISLLSKHIRRCLPKLRLLHRPINNAAPFKSSATSTVVPWRPISSCSPGRSLTLPIQQSRLCKENANVPQNLSEW